MEKVIIVDNVLVGEETEQYIRAGIDPQFYRARTLEGDSCVVYLGDYIKTEEKYNGKEVWRRK